MQNILLQKAYRLKSTRCRSPS